MKLLSYLAEFELSLDGKEKEPRVEENYTEKKVITNESKDKQKLYQFRQTLKGEKLKDKQQDKKQQQGRHRVMKQTILPAALKKQKNRKLNNQNNGEEISPLVM